MNQSHLASEPESGANDSVSSTPRSDQPHKWADNEQHRVRFMCSFGGRIVPRPHDNQLRYVGGDTRIVAVHRTTTFASLLSKLSKLSGSPDITVKYQLPSEDLDALISVTSDEDLENMLEEYDRLAHSTGANSKTARLRIFLFPQGVSRASSIASMLDGGSTKQWFLDALNGSNPLERGRSEVSSIISEVPDYLFGLDADPEAKAKNRTLLSENVSVLSDPGSPAPRVAASPYCSTSSAGGVPADLPPVKTKLESQALPSQPEDATLESEQMIQQQAGYVGSPAWHYVPEPRFQGPTAVPQVPVYYVPAGNAPLRHVPVQVPYVQGLPPPTFRPPIMVNPMAAGHMYGQGVRRAEMKPLAAAGEAYDLQMGVIPDDAQVFYGQRTGVAVPVYPPVGVPLAGDGESRS